MYENQTFVVILQRLLNRVPNTIDKREGSIIYNAHAPTSVELQNVYIELDRILNESFADTQSREYLIKRCAERGITPNPATKAILKGEFNIDIPINSRFSLNDLNYKAIEKISIGVFKMECETAGELGNQNLGILIPIEYIDGLTSSVLTELLTPGENEEETEVLRQRYFDSFEPQAFGGNIADYKQKVNQIQGIGGVKVYRAWNGGGTVKLVIINSEFKKPSSQFINDVQTAIDPIGNQGEGIGIAPIGHVVTVQAVTEETINITTTIVYQNGYDWLDIQTYVENIIDEYFAELNETWENQSSLVVRISQIESRLLNVSGILDISGTKINNVEANFILGENSIAVRGEVIG
jgi:uncharacterized phage protein gp47/JayE